MNIAIRKFYYGDIPEDSGGSNELKDSKASPPAGGGGLSANGRTPLEEGPPIGLYGKSLSAVNKALIINMPAVFMQPMHKWLLKMQETFIPAAWKESVFGWWRVNIYMRAILMRQHNYMNRQMTKYIVIRLFMICLMR